MILCEIDKDGDMVHSYIYADGQILAKCDHTGEEDYFYINDRQGSVRVIADDSGAAQVSYTYDPFGVVIDEAGTFNNLFKFTGQWYDEEISQYYLRARMYDPRLMRFTGYDPVRGGFREPMTLHRYMYCINNPVNFVDPDGEWAVVVGTAFSGAGADFGFTLSAGLYFGINDETGEVFWGTIQWGGVGLSVGTAVSVGIDVAYSPNANSGDDLKGVSWEVGGSGGWLGWGGVSGGTSIPPHDDLSAEKIILITGSGGFGFGAESHVYLIGTKTQPNGGW